MRVASLCAGIGCAEAMSRIQIHPLTLAQANDAIRAWHRHHKPIRAHLWSVGASIDGVLVAGACVERPKAPALCDGFTFEVSRLAIEPSEDRVRNVASRILAACRQAALALGYQRGISYTREDEWGGGHTWHQGGIAPP
jgi:hypothetical protein